MTKSMTEISTPPKTYYIRTHGCQMNEEDSNKMANLLEQKLHMKKNESVKDADLIILNTCSIREKAQEKVFSELGRWVKQIKCKKDTVIAVAGCVASQEADEIFKRAPFVKIVLGPQTIHRLGDLYNNYQKTKRRQIDVSFPTIEKFDHLPENQHSKISSLLTIMEGCNKFCSYCIVPYTRGEEISRDFKDVMQEAKHLAKTGAKEIILLGQNVNDYYGEIDSENKGNLALLIQAISHIENIERIRFTTSHPQAFDETLIEAYDPENKSKLCNHLHLPVQCGSNRVLRNMKRDYTVEKYIEIIEELRKKRPKLRVSTDIIVGFPGETEEDFQQTLDLVDKIGFDISFSFIYSPRPGTPASQLNDEVTLEEKKSRLKRLQERLKHHANRIAEEMIGTTVTVLVEGISKKRDNEISGRTENNRIVNFPGTKEHIGHIVKVIITEKLENSLRGRIQSDDVEKHFGKIKDQVHTVEAASI
ncbi:MAG: tRNA (N6-isopentenyl adenosine(37)-C2)-methylthiotransferase MiaB [Pseudomonadota bacterium]|nr:tRNA (N6-isopentenyl adenosine(37)-C2)-methylthiotransferase MiaB [Pseudomonadota bacterium]